MRTDSCRKKNKIRLKNPYDNIKRYAKAQWIFHEEFGKPITHAWKFKSVMFGKKQLVKLTQKEWNELLEVLRDEFKRLENSEKNKEMEMDHQRQGNR